MFGLLRYRYRAAKYARKDHAEIAFLRSNLRPGDAAIDVGAHKGGYLFWMRRSVGTAGAVFAFEAQPLLAEYLRRMVRGMGWKNVTVEWKGLSAHTGDLHLAVPVTASGVSPGASFEPGKSASEECRVVKVGVTTLDAYVAASAPGRKVSFIKCDVEGHELEVFRGAEKTLKCDRPVLMFECEQRHHFHRSMTDVFDYLHDLGMTGVFFGPGGGLERLATFDPLRHQRVGKEPYCNNFVFRFV